MLILIILTILVFSIYIILKVNIERYLHSIKIKNYKNIKIINDSYIQTTHRLIEDIKMIVQDS